MSALLPEGKAQSLPTSTVSQRTHRALPRSVSGTQVMNGPILSSLPMKQAQKAWFAPASAELTLHSGPHFCTCAGQITFWLLRFVHSFVVHAPDSDLMFYCQWQTIANSWVNCDLYCHRIRMRIYLSAQCPFCLWCYTNNSNGLAGPKCTYELIYSDLMSLYQCPKQ